MLGQLAARCQYPCEIVAEVAPGACYVSGVPTPLHLKPPTAAWIVREARRLNLKPRDISARLEAMGLTATEATVKVWQANGNRRPGPENLEGLERIFGSRAPEPPGHADDALASAIRDQTRVFSELVAELRTMCEAMRETGLGVARVEGRIGEIEAALSAPQPGAARRRTEPGSIRA